MPLSVGLGGGENLAAATPTDMPYAEGSPPEKA